MLSMRAWTFNPPPPSPRKSMNSKNLKFLKFYALITVSYNHIYNIYNFTYIYIYHGFNHGLCWNDTCYEYNQSMFAELL